MSDIKLEGIKVYGPNSVDGTPHLWHFPDEDFAVAFAENACRETDGTFLLLKAIRMVKPAEKPVVWTVAK